MCVESTRRGETAENLSQRLIHTGCGTLDYRREMRDHETSKFLGANLIQSGAKHDMTCLTIKGMILTFCEYMKAGIIPPAINLGYGGNETGGNGTRLGVHPAMRDVMASTFDFLGSSVDDLPLKYLSFDFLASYETCMERCGRSENSRSRPDRLSFFLNEMNYLGLPSTRVEE